MLFLKYTLMVGYEQVYNMCITRELLNMGCWPYAYCGIDLFRFLGILLIYENHNI